MEPGDPRHEPEDVNASGEPSEGERAIRATALGAALGALLALLGRASSR